MTSSDNFKETLKQQADIVRIVGDYVKLRKAGAQNFSGLCPFHSEKTASFSVHATRQFYHCFGCGASGDIFSFVQKVENISFPEAVRLIAQKLGVPMPKVTFSSPAEAKEAHLRGALLDVHERATTFFRECLRRIRVFCCAMHCAVNSTRSCCGRAGCFRGRRRLRVTSREPRASKMSGLLGVQVKVLGRMLGRMRSLAPRGMTMRGRGLLRAES
ncbi:MAG: CHC2 zinc finger domain-containing protein [Terriglobales bacterium]